MPARQTEDLREVPAHEFQEGTVVGVYRNAIGFHGFLWERLRFRTVDFPGASATRVFGINSGGDVVGSYADAAGKVHAFVASVGKKRCK